MRHSHSICFIIPVQRVTCKALKGPKQGPFKAGTGNKVALGCDEPSPTLCSPWFCLGAVLRLCRSSPANFSFQHGWKGSRREGQSLAKHGWDEFMHRVGMSLRHFTPQRGMGTEGAHIPEREPFWGEVTHEQALQPYQVGWGHRWKGSGLDGQRGIYREIQMPCPRHLPSFSSHTLQSSINSPHITSWPSETLLTHSSALPLNHCHSKFCCCHSVLCSSSFSYIWQLQASQRQIPPWDTGHKKLSKPQRFMVGKGGSWRGIKTFNWD